MCFYFLMVLVSYKILTPPSENIILKSPNLKYEAKLKIFYYLEKNKPSYKIYFRKKNELIWKNLIYIPYTELSPKIFIKWSSDSSYLKLLDNNQLIKKLRFQSNFWGCCRLLKKIIIISCVFTFNYFHGILWTNSR